MMKRRVLIAAALADSLFAGCDSANANLMPTGETTHIQMALLPVE